MKECRSFFFVIAFCLVVGCSKHSKIAPSANGTGRHQASTAKPDGKVEPQPDQQLLSAIDKHDVVAVRRALAHGADPNAITTQGNGTALGIAASGGDVEVIKILLAAGAKINLGDAAHNLSPLQYAIALKRIPAIKVLLDSGADVNVRDSKGRNAMQFAEMIKDQEIVELLKYHAWERAQRKN